MKVIEAVFNTDGVNRHKLLLPLSVMVQSMEHHLADAIKAGLSPGTPSNIAHDLCRPAGWAVASGVYIAKDKSRQLGSIILPDTDEDWSLVETLIQKFQNNHTSQSVAPFADELLARLGLDLSSAPIFWHGEASAVVSEGLAARMFPEFFSGGKFADKDGLADYTALLARTRQIYPGVFHEPNRDILLFAHRFFRRSLSRRNSLNQYVLRSFDEAASKGLPARLRLDPDLLGHPESAKAIIELEYWHGPRFDNDLSKIASGVAQHASTASEREYSRIDKTQVWWKNPETRHDDQGVAQQFRTLEIEELVEDPSPGLDDEGFGCRYAHAEYDIALDRISHFDGAIRAYAGEEYLSRIERSIDRAGKQSEYTKLFRFDGDVPISTWKRVLSDYFRGNELIPEYLGGYSNVASSQSPVETPSGLEPEVEPGLSAYCSLESCNNETNSTLRLIPNHTLKINDISVGCAEIGLGSVAKLLETWSAGYSYGRLTVQDSVANLATIELPDDGSCQLGALSAKLVDAIGKCIKAGELGSISVAFAWRHNDVKTTLSIAGEAELVHIALRDAFPAVRPDQATHIWIEPFRDSLVSLMPALDAPVAWPRSAPQLGRINLRRQAEIRCNIRIPGWSDRSIIDPP
jgi:hypothetical protein